MFKMEKPIARDDEREASLAISELEDKMRNLLYKYRDYGVLWHEQFKFKDQELGFRHSQSRAHMKIYDTGDIQMFFADHAGMIVSAKYETMNLYGKAINITTPLVRFETKPMGFMWNNHLLNPRLYQISDKKNPLYWDRKRTEPFPGMFYTDDLQLLCTARWWCPGVPSLCGNPLPHGGHWVRYNLSLTPFFWAMEDEDYRAMLKQFDIPREW